MMAASDPWALREPNSMMALPSAALTMRLDFVAIRLWCDMISSAIVSMNCAWMAGPLTTTMGS